MKEGNKALKIVLIVIIAIAVLAGGYFGYRALTDKTRGNGSDIDNPTITPLLYEVTKEGSENKIYLFGSIHAAKSIDLVFPKYILDAYNNSHYLACEADMDAYSKDYEATVTTVMKLLYEDETTVKDHLSSATYDKMVKFLTEKKSYAALYDSYKPYFFVSLISELMIADSKLSANSGVDLYFLKKAKEDNKTILEVESVDFQEDLFLSFPDGLYDLIINEIIDGYQEEVDGLKKLYEAWKTGNAADLEKYGSDDLDEKDSYTKTQKAYIEDYNTKLVVERNKTMAEKAVEYFDNNQDTFFMVGAFHIVGDTGLVKQLEQKGFTVKQITK